MLSTADSTTVMIVEDDSAICEMLAFTLSRAGMETLKAGDANSALEYLSLRTPDIVILDWMLPGTSGLEILRRIRRESRTKDLPVMMLTARGAAEDRIKAFQSGADDYVVKPFSREELLLRIEAILRRSLPNRVAAQHRFGQLILDAVSHRVSVEEKSVDLGRVEFRLLRHFMAHPERVFSRAQLLDKVWRRAGYVEERTVDVHIMRIRAALRSVQCPDCIQTVRGLGYRFSPDKLTGKGRENGNGTAPHPR